MTHQVTDADLDRESPEDEPMVLAWALAARISHRAKVRGAQNGTELGYGLKALSELTYKIAANNPGNSDAIAEQLESMAAYVRKNMK